MAQATRLRAGDYLTDGERLVAVLDQFEADSFYAEDVITEMVVVIKGDNIGDWRRVVPKRAD